MAAPHGHAQQRKTGNAQRRDNAQVSARAGIPAGLKPGVPVLIAGPTASGKSALAMAIARRLNGVVINADALQVFANWRVLTARPSARDEARVAHALYGHVPGSAPYSVGQWLRDLAPLLRDARRTPVIVGGTGLYLSALTGGLAEIPPTPARVRRAALERLARGALDEMLSEIDPQTRARIDRNNPMRVQRAWEVQQTTGRGLASWQDQTPPALLPIARAQPLLLMPERDRLNARIERRFDAMLEQGALEEARANRASWSRDLPSAKAIGAAQLMDWLDGTITLAQARERAIVATRQYAKRQRSWFRARMADWPRLPAP